MKLIPWVTIFKRKEAQLTKLAFILDRWHVGQFVKVTFKDWKYE